MNATALFSARQISQALGVSKRGVLIALEKYGSPAKIGEKLVRGQEGTRAWEFCALPVLMQARLERLASDQGYASAQALLTACEAPAKPPPQSPAPAPDRSLHRDLAAWIEKLIPDPANLSESDREELWVEAVSHMKVLSSVTAPAERGKLTLSLAKFLSKEVPGLVRAGTRNPVKSLRRDLQRKRDYTREDFRNHRNLTSGNHRGVVSADDWNTYTRELVSNGGNEVAACNHLREVSPDFAKRHPGQTVPKSLRDGAAPFVRPALIFKRSPAAGRLAGPYIVRDWSDTSAGDFFVSDDVTWDIIAAVETGDPERPYKAHRQECLYTGDELSGCPLKHLLINGDYTGLDIARLRLLVHDSFGLPRFSEKLENGIWRGRFADPDDTGFREHQREVESWINEILGRPPGVRHFIPRNPKAKVIESDFNIFQRMMKSLPGYVGSDERRTKSDDLKRRERKLAAGEDPRALGILTRTQLNEKISQLEEEFMHTKRKSGRIAGRTPFEAFSEATNRAPLTRLEPAQRWLVSTHRRLVTVHDYGVLFEPAKNQKWAFADGQLGLLQGQKVWIFYNIDCPNLATFANEKRTEYFSVVGNRLPANTASREQLGDAHRRISDFNAIPRALAGGAKHPVVNTKSLDKLTTEAGDKFGRHVESSVAESRENQAREQNQRSLQKSEGLEMLLGALQSQEEENAL